MRSKAKVAGVMLSLAGATAMMMGNSGGRAAVGGHGATGAPAETGQLCIGCHNGGPFGPTIELLEITSGGQLVATYRPGQVYDVKMTAAAGAGNPAGYGFQLTAIDGARNNVGTFGNLGANVKESVAANTGNRKYLEHKGGMSATREFTAKWTAPAQAAGDVDFHYNGVVANGNGNQNGDNGGLGSSITLSVFRLPMPYFHDFEFGDGGWTSYESPATPMPAWTWGAGQAATVGDPQAFGVAGNGMGGGVVGYLELPPLDLSMSTLDPIIAFAIHYDTEPGVAGGWLELSTDGGVGWAPLGGIGEGEGWYDDQSPIHGPMWGGESQGWSYAEHELTGTAGHAYVLARFAFTVGEGTSLDVFGVDDVMVDPAPGDPLWEPTLEGGSDGGDDWGTSDGGDWDTTDGGTSRGGDDWGTSGGPGDGGQGSTSWAGSTSTGWSEPPPPWPVPEPMATTTF
ncbi:choice-of-anchor V domain-containing protein [Paraliomyxa miuraensis]|uniref:choice-of-anchor V domain-containing protein n=1 Tax=Paraliomyxa miuraensis TaxID=376150 RepID=UPI002254F17A|nr:choice-of-anchor V domain-containing protein [Paraliomyxa miuraensis]MCX4241956.1 hypothetical protein [Paraliomyxa miuraensis]